MELRQLRYLIAVIEEGGFAQASARLQTPKSTIVCQIKNLERELGSPLFHTRCGGSRPTEAGRVLFQHAQDAMEVVRKTHNAVEDIEENVVSGEIRVGSVNSAGIYFLPQVMRRFRNRYPKVRVTVTCRESDEILEDLLSGLIDVALLDNPQPDRRLYMETIIKEPISLVCGNSHPFFGRKAVKPREIRGLRYISLSSDNPTGRIVQEYLSKLGLWVKPVVSTDNVQTAKKMAESGLGVTFLPDMVTSPDINCQGKALGGLARIRVNPLCNRCLVLAIPRHTEINRSLSFFVNEIRNRGSQWTGCSESIENLRKPGAFPISPEPF